MEKIINLDIPHVGEHIFASINTPDLVKFLEVSEAWKALAENVLLKRWKGKMFEACEKGETKVVQLLLENLTSEENGLNTKNEVGMTAFIIACAIGHKDVVKLLLDHSESNIDLNATINGWPAFMAACYHGDTDVVQLLLDHSDRIDLNAKDVRNGGTAFFKACYSGFIGNVQFWLTL